MASFGEVLAHFKEHDESNIDSLVPLMDDVSMRHGLAAWKAVPIKFKKDIGDCPYKDDNDRWKWLWECVDVDQQEFAVMSGIRIQDAVSIMRRLIGLRLVYPDGTISQLSFEFLKAIILEQINKAAKKRPKKSPKKSEKS